MAAPRLCEFVDSLPKSANKLEDLQQIKILITQIPLRILRDIVPNISFNVIFECLDTTDGDLLTECCDVLDKLLEAVDPTVILAQFQEDLTQGLGHSYQAVLLLCIHQTQRVADVRPQELSLHPRILSEIINIIGQESLHVAKKAATVLMTLGGSTDAVDFLFRGPGLVGLQRLVESAEEVRFRAYELIVDISGLSLENLTMCSSCGLLQKLVNEVHKDDILVQLNAVELLSRLAAVPHGLAYMEQQGIVTRLDQMLQERDTNPMMGFLIPGLVKFFGRVGYIQPKEVCQRHPSFLPLLFTMIEDQDPSSRALSAETIGLIGGSAEGKHVLEQHGPGMNAACKHMGSLLKDPSNDIKVRALGAIESLLKLPVPEQTTDLLSLTESWFSRLSPDPMALFLDLLDKPFDQVRCATYGILVVMAAQTWGQSRFRDHPTFSEFLLNRGTENTKQGKEMKYKIILELVESPTAMEVLGRVYFVKLKEYVKEGPFFIRAESAVAMDSET